MGMRDKIITGAGELFFRVGFSKVRMEEIAEYLGISKKTIYNHFDTKESLFDESILVSVTRIIDELQRITEDPELSFPQKLAQVLEEAYRVVGMKDPAFFRDLNRHNQGLDGRPLVILQEKTLSIILSLIRQAEGQGIISSPIPAERLAQVFQNIVEGLTSQKPDLEGSVDRVRVLKDSLEAILSGILTSKGHEILDASFLQTDLEIGS